MTESSEEFILLLLLFQLVFFQFYVEREYPLADANGTWRFCGTPVETTALGFECKLPGK